MFEQRASRPNTLAALLVCFLIASPSGAVAQGSAGGSIGNDDKSLSGSRPEPRSVEPERPARRSKPQAEEPRRATPRASGGGGGGGFDGAWAVVAVGTTCQGTTSGAIVITSGKIIGQGIVSGHVSANGAASAVGNSDGLVVNSSGRFSGHSGSGTYRRSDGCIGRWSASKQ